MCQMSIVFEKNGQQEKVLENASSLEVNGNDITISALFDEPKVINNSKVQKIDFLDGIVTLIANE